MRQTSLTQNLFPVLLFLIVGCDSTIRKPHRVPAQGLPDPGAVSSRILPPEFAKRLSIAALERTKHKVRYDSTYRHIAYPMGDVPEHFGVCTDVVIRAYRVLGIDLQKEVHEDMEQNFNLYPTKWGLSSPDTNIDHRRVQNLEMFFQRKGLEVAATQNPEHYLPGDIVTWTVHKDRPHIGIVVNQIANDNKTPLIVHNNGRDDVLDDVLFQYPITGHFRYVNTVPGLTDGKDEDQSGRASTVSEKTCLNCVSIRPLRNRKPPGNEN